MTQKDLIFGYGKLGYRADIDGLRAIAILLVLIFHAFPEYLPGGFIGVDVFFVISGFLISTIIFEHLENNTFSYLYFYSRRIKRIFPGLLFTLITCYLVGWYILFPNEFRQLGKHIASGAAFVSNVVLWNEVGYFEQDATKNPLLHLWSLATEEQFYIFLPLLLAFIWKRKYNFLIVITFIMILSFVINILSTRHDSIAGFYSPLSRFWELALGCTLAYLKLYKSNYLIRQANLRALLGCILIAASTLLLNQEKHFPGLWALLPTLGAFLIISSGEKAWINRRILSNKILVWLGLISFPLYLVHWPLLSFARIIEVDKLRWSIRCTICLISIFIAFIIYQYIEKPIRQHSARKLKPILLLIFVILSGILGYITFLFNGFNSRFPVIIQKIINHADYNYHVGYREGSCFLKPDQDYHNFKVNDCTTHNSAHSLIYLWGDSHAAHLYPGLKETLEKNYRITQLTASACPPILGMTLKNRPHCKRINDFVFKQIKKEVPNSVILAANWTFYKWREIDFTIQKLHSSGIKNIIIVGPVPNWSRGGLPVTMLNLVKNSRLGIIPKRLKEGLNIRAQEVDKKMFLYTKEQNLYYISPIKILCNDNGCLAAAKIGNTEELTAWDQAHLTDIGSYTLVSHFPSSYFNG
ncbi:acyltransferase family protein [Legionella tucsonensis]|uniref:O-antigen acetylase n=1 Tax=Legionella tucsonensis TaxID=40335 RepID=A0A0W0ZTU7_9GAMM|nr:acyltransferase family protein [Legionella tucsonensis]KTD72256.1 O-antigen acetylase [Legionella tucsonensis]